MMKKLTAYIVLAAFAGFLLAGCSSTEGSAPENAKPPTPEKDTGKPGERGGGVQPLVPDR
jgi:PBP1b-binding outer membrane lipoprotein LpoB